MDNTYHFLSGNLLKAVGPLKCPAGLSPSHTFSAYLLYSFHFCSNVLAAVWMAMNTGISAFSSPRLDYQQSPPLSETAALFLCPSGGYFSNFFPPQIHHFSGCRSPKGILLLLHINLPNFISSYVAPSQPSWVIISATG